MELGGGFVSERKELWGSWAYYKSLTVTDIFANTLCFKHVLDPA